jgi:thioredoxin-dependent adenylylsulfate APS reductase
VSELSRAAAELEQAGAEHILRWTYSHFRRVAIVASFQAESTVLIDMAAQLVARPEVVTLDTGRLPQETHDQIDRELASHRVRLQVQAPDPDEIKALAAEHGANPFYRSAELRRLCCDVRKSRPLAKALEGYDAWITGLRRDQGVTRAGTPVVAEDRAHGGIAKVAPLVRWSEEEVWDRIRSRGLPYHELYDRGYRSIGCAPCTRAVREGEDARAGRWWWEQEEEVKECGLHWSVPVAVP